MTDPIATPTRVLIVDDHKMFATAMARLLDLEPDMVSAGVADNLASARGLIQAATPDVVLLDYRFEDGDGVASLPELRELRPSARFVILTASTADSVLAAAIEGGASGFVSKSREVAEALAAVRLASHGEAVISPDVLVGLMSRMYRGGLPGNNELTERELELLDLLTEGLSNDAIAERMTVSVFTVRNHVAHLSAKLGAHSKLEVLTIAISQGLVPDH
jgi:DNA-binding NarL/FixJ family response regulator